VQAEVPSATFWRMPRAFVSLAAPRVSLENPSLWFIFRGQQLVVRSVAPGQVELPQTSGLATVGLLPLRTQFLGEFSGVPCQAAEIDEAAPLPEGLSSEGLRALFGRLDEEVWAVAGRAFQIIDWDRTHQFCGRCGERTEQSEGERSKKCPRCKLLAYPRVAPAVIVLIRRGQEALLARGNRFPAAFYSTLAGFVEPGESLEDTLAREVREEVGVELKDLRYFGSQPWPFPHSLMVGFMAQYAGGEVTPDASEIVDAGWFTVDALPELPGRLSIARKLIDAWIAEVRSGKASSISTG